MSPTRRTVLLAALALPFAAGCQGAAPPLDLSAPPTEYERRVLGVDAYNDYFLTMWRKCTRYASEGTCHKQMYGGDNGFR